MAEKIGVFLVGDHQIFRSGMARLIASDPCMEIVGESGATPDLMEALDRLRPDVCLIMSGVAEMEECLSTVSLIKKERSTAQVLLLGGPAPDDGALAILRKGEISFLDKDHSPEDLLAQIRNASRGRSSREPAIVADLKRQVDLDPAEPRSFERELSARETEILKFVASGFPNQAIADKLSISERTVRTHVSNILAKLNLENRTQAALFAIRKGLA